MKVKTHDGRVLTVRGTAFNAAKLSADPDSRTPVLRFKHKGKDEVFEKAIVRPEFGERGKIRISETAIAQMVNHCVDEFDDTISVRKIQVKNDPRGYNLKITIHIPLGIQMSGSIHNLQEYIIEKISKKPP